MVTTSAARNTTPTIQTARTRKLAVSRVAALAA